MQETQMIERVSAQEAQITNFITSAAQLQEQLDVALAERDAALGAQGALQAELTVTEGLRAKAEAEQAVAQNEAASQANQLKEARTLAEANDAKVHALQAEAAGTAKQASELKLKTQSLQDANAGLNRRFNALMEESLQHRQLRAELKADLAKLAERAAAAEQARATTEAELAQQAQHALACKQRMEQAAEELKKELNTRESQADSAEGANAKLQEMLSHFTARGRASDIQHAADMDQLCEKLANSKAARLAAETGAATESRQWECSLKNANRSAAAAEARAEDLAKKLTVAIARLATEESLRVALETEVGKASADAQWLAEDCASLKRCGAKGLC